MYVTLLSEKEPSMSRITGPQIFCIWIYHSPSGFTVSVDEALLFRVASTIRYVSGCMDFAPDEARLALLIAKAWPVTRPQ
jgi:hypothetical protein